MVRRKFNLNIFDLFVVAAILAVLSIVLFSYSNRPYLGSRTVQVELKVSGAETIQAILPGVETTDEIYYSGTKYPVKQVSYRAEADYSGQINNLYIIIQGPGDITSEKSIFNGQRIYLNQKAEIHSGYQAQGYVVDFYYAD
jgi:hypothetical protein